MTVALICVQLNPVCSCFALQLLYSADLLCNVEDCPTGSMLSTSFNHNAVLMQVVVHIYPSPGAFFHPGTILLTQHSLFCLRGLLNVFMTL